MATVQLQSLTLSRSSSLSAPTTTASSISGRRSSLKLPRHAGLRLAASTRFSGSPSRAVTRIAASRAGGRVVCEAQDTAAVQVEPVTDSNWQSLVLESDTPVLVEFWAPWCGPCRMIHPIIDELAKEYTGKLKCYKLNTDESPSTATRYGIRSIPTVIIFKNGEKKDAVIGAVRRQH